MAPAADAHWPDQGRIGSRW